MGIIANYKSVTLEELQKLQNNEIDTCEFLYKDCIDIEKSWDALKYILTGGVGITGNVLDNIIPMSFENILNDNDMGMGPAVYIDVKTVEEMSKELNTITLEDFKSKIDVEKMSANNILCSWDFKTIFEYTYSYFLKLKEFFNQSAKHGKYIIVWLD